jgi:hypothetical protein
VKTYGDIGYDNLIYRSSADQRILQEVPGERTIPAGVDFSIHFLSALQRGDRCLATPIHVRQNYEWMEKKDVRKSYRGLVLGEFQLLYSLL